MTVRIFFQNLLGFGEVKRIWNMKLMNAQARGAILVGEVCHAIRYHSPNLAIINRLSSSTRQRRVPAKDIGLVVE
jgi:hypothetical protein